MNEQQLEDTKPDETISEEKLALQLGLDVLSNLSDLRLSKEIYQQVPYAFVRKHLALPVAENANGEIIVAIADPLNISPIEELRHMLGRTIVSAYAEKDTLIAHMHDCYEKEDGAASELIADMAGRIDAKLGEEAEVYDLLDDNKDQPAVVKLLNLILTEAIQQGASDIHFEPNEDGVMVRYRIDGVLQKRHNSGADYQSQLLTRIKVMSKMDIAERRLPQDGRIKLRMGNREIDFRVSTIPIVNGERIVLRILDKGNVVIGFDKIGMPTKSFRGFEKLINLPEGIVLVTGPTGSGKTTTLYSAICSLQGDHTNIMTIEDPVEYNLKSIAQIGIKPKIGLDFSRGLRHILRQDPDIIMIGEIRDRETAEIAIQASLTGHLVLSTLHTNDAPSAVTRLVDMGIEPYLLSSSLVGVLAQRLVRCICSDCKETYTPDPEELSNLGLSPDDLNDGALCRGKGCAKCYQSGYRGRHGIYELMEVNHTLQKQIVSSGDAIRLRQLACEAGMESLREHGSELVKQGITTVAEVLRVTRGIE
jgi:general secretion pathway protein E